LVLNARIPGVYTHTQAHEKPHAEPAWRIDRFKVLDQEGVMAQVQVRRSRIFEAISCERLYGDPCTSRYGREQRILHRDSFNGDMKLDLGRGFGTVLNDIFGLAGQTIRFAATLRRDRVTNRLLSDATGVLGLRLATEASTHTGRHLPRDREYE
jgi:hypothetical protein